MRVRLSGSTITAHGDSLGTPYVEFPGNEPLGFPTGWTISGSSPNRLLVDPNGHEFSRELVTPGTMPVPSGGAAQTVSLLGPFHVTFETVGFVSPADDGIEIFDIPAGSLGRVIVIVRTLFDSGAIYISIGDYSGGSVRGGGTWKAGSSNVNAFVAGEGHVVNTGPDATELGIPSFFVALQAAKVIAQWIPDAGATQGAADIYVLIATPS